MGQRPDQIGRDPGRRNPLDEGVRDPDSLTQPLVDPVVEEREVVVEGPYVEPEPYEPSRPYEVREINAGTGPGIMGTIRQNPLPAALTGIGLGWLLMSARSSGSSRQGRYGAGVYTHDYPSRYEGQHSTGGTTSAGEVVGRARDTVGETATQTQDKAGELANRTQDKVGNLGNQARYQTQRASGGFQRMLHENPLAMGALGIGVGAALGLAIPETNKEHEVMGEARDNLVDKAQEKVQETQEKVQQVAEEARSAAQDEAENQGLTNQ